ncbi:MAG: polysaccharide deacetylase family protein [Candidatus Natronoplasma sp.]
MPSVAITGDVHHYLGNHLIEKKEHLFAKEYLEIISEYDAKATLFVTGKCIENHQEHWKRLHREYPLEIGGHTYYAFQPPSIFYGYKDLFGRFGLTYGPLFYQLLDISKTVRAFEKANIPIQSWRTHAYRGDKVTGKLLPDFGIKYVSELKSLPNEKLIDLPINCYPDDHVFLATLTEKKFDPEEEMRKVKESISKNIELKKDMVIQLHPGSMKVLDDYKTFNSIIEKLIDAGYEFKTISELGESISDNISESPEALAYFEG